MRLLHTVRAALAMDGHLIHRSDSTKLRSGADEDEAMSDGTWNSAITDIAPNEIRVRGYRVDELMGRVDFGQAVYLPAGELHSYLAGCGAEIMANSDNVLRGGLTPKHVNLPELLDVLTFSSGPAQILDPSETTPGVWTYPTPVAEFELSRIEVSGEHLRESTNAPEILLCTAGRGRLEGVDGQAALDTIRAYNAAVRSDLAFDPIVKDGRCTEGLAVPKSNWANPIDEPPFEAYAVTCGITFTFGGLRIDTQARVMDSDLVPIPGLYAAGELVGGLFYSNYPGGTGLMAGAVFGKIAGTSAAGAGGGADAS